MKIFLDTANLDEIKAWRDFGIADGVTTNPTILRKEGIIGSDMIEKHIKKIIEILPSKPIFVEVTSQNHLEIDSQAKEFSGWSPHVKIKVPVIDIHGQPNFGVINKLSWNGICINATACFSLGQIILAAKAGARYGSLFTGRIADEGGDPWWLVSKSVEWIKHWGYGCDIIVGSVRSVMDIQNAALAGTDIITVPPSLLIKWADHRYSRDTVRQFIRDAQAQEV